jgi:hypothetical protein
MMIWGNGMSGWAMTLMGLSNLLFWGLLITGIVLLVRRPDRSTSARGPAGAGPTPQQVPAPCRAGRRPWPGPMALPCESAVPDDDI